MAPPSIQSFYSSSPSKVSNRSLPAKPSSPSTLPSSSPPSHPSPSTATEPGDGFTADEIDTVIHPPSAQWTPTQDYEEVEIGALEPGPKYVTFVGRIVNFYDLAKAGKRPQSAKGCLKLMVGDDTGAVTVRLWYADIRYEVRLGQLVKVWTVHVSHGEQASLAPTAAPLFTSIFPERERVCHFMLHERNGSGILCRRPYRYKENQELPGLMTLKNFTNGGYDVEECKVLVCVKSIGARKKFTQKSGNTSELISVMIFDDTAEAALTLYGSMCISASQWQPSQTILLISNPAWRIERMAKLSLNGNTRVDIDPDISDAAWLRSLAQRLTKREHVNPAFLYDIFDTEAAEAAAMRALYNLADIDELYAVPFSRWQRITDKLIVPELIRKVVNILSFKRQVSLLTELERFMGYISVLLTEVHLVQNFKRSMLMSTECCGMPLYANAVTAKCRQCDETVPLRINPKIIGPVIDETGQVATGKLIFSDTAWQQLLGRTPEQLVKSALDVLGYLENRLLFLRVSMGFGWCLEGSRPLPSTQEEYEANLRLHGRKRKRLDVFKQIDKETANRRKPADNQVESTPQPVEDGVGDVGRLCIWCVKM